MILLNTDIKNKVLQSMMKILDGKRNEIIAANQKDLDLFDKADRAMYDRLLVVAQKLNGMIADIQ
ncbi:MAG: glutamate-5-semialdehyde dehydrogenase, partial [Arenibacter algicola]|nr:glutamate-5-semialdehyde dehydrogenase [Arenibacter algicola]